MTMKVTVELYLSEKEVSYLDEKAALMRISGIEGTESYSIEDEINYLVHQAIENAQKPRRAVWEP